MKEHSEKLNTTFLYREDLDTNAYLEEILIDESQNKLLYGILMGIILLLLIVYLAW
jgi:uncharacterized integral membrane protein